MHEFRSVNPNASRSVPGVSVRESRVTDPPPALKKRRKAKASRVVCAGEGLRTLGREVASPVQNLLWGRAAGRCEFTNCNRVLSRAPATQETRNIAEKAHIYAFSDRGPRASGDWPTELLNTVENLLLVCHDCHKVIDAAGGPARYTAALLQAMKERHERRVEVVTGVPLDRASHVLTYGALVGEHAAVPTFDAAAAALFPECFPASAQAIRLGTRAGSQRDRDAAYWSEHRRELGYEFDRQVRLPLDRGEVSHLSVFALAPQPLLIELGVLLGDITPAEVYNLHREPRGWRWPDTGGSPVPIIVLPPEPPELPAAPAQSNSPSHADGAATQVPAQVPAPVPALVLAVSATVTPDRITRVLGDGAAIWEVRVPEPHNDVVKARETLAEFRRAVRGVLDRIKARHGHATPVHVFPALPASLAVEFGRARMPKADAPWVLYDEHQSRGGFVRTFEIVAGVAA